LAQLTERRRTCRRKRCSELASPLVSSPGVSSQLNTSGRYFTPRRAGCLASCPPLAQFPIYRARIPGEGCRCARVASRFRGASRIWRSHCCAAGLGCVGCSAQRVRHPLGLGIQPLGQCRSSQRLLSSSASGLEAGMLQATYFIPTFIVPLLLITHVLVLLILIRRDSVAAAQ